MKRIQTCVCVELKRSVSTKTRIACLAGRTKVDRKYQYSVTTKEILVKAGPEKTGIVQDGGRPEEICAVRSSNSRLLNLTSPRTCHTFKWS